MLRVRLLAPLTFGPGTLLWLGEAQVRRRAHSGVLEPVAGGGVRTLREVQFKAGELLVLDDLPRAFAALVEQLDGDSAPLGIDHVAVADAAAAARVPPVLPASAKPAVKRAPKRA